MRSVKDKGSSTGGAARSVDVAARYLDPQKLLVPSEPRHLALTEYVLWIVGDVVFPYERKQLRREVHAAMMVFLFADITYDGRNKGGTEPKCGVAYLPRKFRTLLVNPWGGIWFD